MVQEAGWAPEPVWTSGKSRPHQDSSPDRPARSSVAIPTELPGPQSHTVFLVTGTVAAQKHNSLLHNSIKNELKVKIFAVLGRYTA